MTKPATIGCTLLGRAMRAFLRWTPVASARSAEMLDAALAHVGYGILMIDADGRVAVANQRLTVLLGLPPGLAVPGRLVTEIVAWQEQAGEFADIATAKPDHHAGLAVHPGEAAFINERVRPDGTVLQIRTEALPSGGHVRTFTDITLVRREAQALAESRDRAEAAEAAFAAVFEDVPHGIIVVGADDCVQMVNQRAIELANIPPEHARPGVSLATVLQAHIEQGDYDHLPGFAEQALQNLLCRDVDFFYERLTREGRWLGIRTKVLPDRRIIRTFTDFTAIRHAEDEADRARSAATAAMRARIELLTVVSHELRTPLHAVLGLADLLLLEGLAPQQAEFVGEIARSGENLNTLITALLDAAELERGQVTLRLDSYDFAQVVRDVGAFAQPRAAAKGMVLDVQIEGAVPDCVLGDAGRLRQILLLLLDNAVKFTDVGSVQLRAAILPEDDGWRATVTVSDSGIGIAEDAKASLFEPFFLADSSSTRRFGGAGLGLARCRMLVTAMGGTIGVESEIGRGSRFEVHLPLRRVPTLPV